ncbi:MAG: ribonuclease D [Rhodospirillales bacterium]|nr:ribonuclease D [Rhodospirillales bacterium]
MIITEQNKLDALCADLSQAPFITIDTEFLREKTYYPLLCLVQVAAPDGEPAAIDPLVGDLDLTPLFDLLANKNVVKVFHAARQDLEIFYNMMGKVPHPIFDTQVAAMVCGYGDQVGYSNLVQTITGVQLDKAQQFTDWSRRPLSNKQLVYALDDVTHLRNVYGKLKAELADRGRLGWEEEEMAILTSADTYQNKPEEAWRRVKIRSDKPRTLAVLRELAAWREREAQSRDIPRPRVLKDDTLAEIALQTPKTVDTLSHLRGFSADMARGKLGKNVLEAVKKGLDTPKEDCPHVQRKQRLPIEKGPALEMLKMLLRIQAGEHGVAAKLIASADDLEDLARDEREEIPAMRGWRYDVFGKEAQALLKGRLGLTLRNGKIEKLEL